MARERTQPVTIKATHWQISSWEKIARIFSNGDLPRFIVLSADLTVRNLRELCAGRARVSAVEQRVDEKRRLGVLMKAATSSLHYLPKTSQGLYGQTYPQRDLRDAIESVKNWLEETGEEYGPCD